MKGLGAGSMEVFVPEEPELVERCEYQIDPSLDGCGCLILMVGEVHMGKIVLLEGYPGQMEEAKHDGVRAKGSLGGQEQLVFWRKARGVGRSAGVGSEEACQGAS
jgi:hypothetical protein